MSEAAPEGEGGHHGLYGDPTADFFGPFDHDVNVDSFFLLRSPCSAAGEGVGDGLAAYSSSIADYLQGFLQDDDGGVVKQEMVVQAAVSGHDDRVLGASATPNSSSSEAVCGEEPRRRCKKGRVDEEEEEEIDDDEEEEGSAAADRNCKGNKGEKKRGDKKKKKNVRQPRVAFMTKSEVDHLEDGYRWRKYGQKAVKNSSYPRSYYRCTAARCGVKKLVERSQQDPSSVITTYEGQHTHPSPVDLGGRAASMRAFMQQQPPQLGLGLLRPDDLTARAMALGHLGYGGHGARVPSSLLPAAGDGMRSPMSTTHLLQMQERRASSPLVATYGAAPALVPPAAMGDVRAHEHC